MNLTIFFIIFVSLNKPIITLKTYATWRTDKPMADVIATKLNNIYEIIDHYIDGDGDLVLEVRYE